MGAVFPEEKPAFFSMITGTVNEFFAYSHHYKWWTEMKAKEQQWRQRRDREAAEETVPRGEPRGAPPKG